MTTQVTVTLNQAHQPVDVQVLTRQRDGTFTAPMPPTRLARVGDTCTYHVHGNQRLQVIEAEGEAVAAAVPPPLPSAPTEEAADIEASEEVDDHA
jgi:hypothetical protein